MASLLRVSVLLCLGLTSAPLAQQHQHPDGDRLGTVKFETSCAASAAAPFNRAMALLHSFEFGPAIEGFQSTLTADLEGLFPAQTDHPGITHYIIHSYDVPALAPKAAAAAKRYATIAPAAPHALHMPSHTFTRVGAWQGSIDSNIASADAARKAGARAEELHAITA